MKLDPLTLSPIMPVVKISKLEYALPIAEALLAGGIATIEVTLRTPCGLAAIEEIAKKLPEMKVGAGTITTRSQLGECRDSGALFGLSPGATDALLKGAQAMDWPFVPGVATASEIMQAMDHGFSAMKFFPAQASGGVAMLKSFSGPFANIRFCPTGGVTPTNLIDYLSLDNVGCVGGTWLTPADLVETGQWQAISQLCREALAICQQ
ncbi:MAG: bifunctional 4-hydroxy-2-oxoglutarate aldolase/2-dehydro-3-deoxy-phosphogluconate aldolase [Pseudomonadales bacterium]|nr:bifunctional 4-hydroxy-2-oxoglutarate aldolase/2-dehydro-3-deoxy-phosphogluconate aldolase [Pseudomonadales bacterium]